jgi:hypothetical protein
MKPQLMATGLLLAFSSMGLAAEQCKIQNAISGTSIGSAALDQGRDTLYFTPDWGTDKIHALDLETGKAKVMDLGPEWKYRIQTIATGTGSYIYAVGNYQPTKEYEVDENGVSNVHAAVFKIAKHDGEIVDMIKLWRYEDDGDESGFGSVALDEGDDRLYVVLEYEGDYVNMAVIDTDTMKTVKEESKKIDQQIDKADFYSSLGGMALDDEQGMIYEAFQGSLYSFGARGQKSKRFELALADADESPSLTYDRKDNSLLMSYETWDGSASEAIVGRLSLKGDLISSVKIEEFSQSRSGITEAFPTADQDKILVLGYQGTDDNIYSSLLLEVDLETGATQPLCE